MKLKFYETNSVGMYVWLIQHGFTDVSYDTDRGGKMTWHWIETDELNESVKEYYSTPLPDFERIRNSKIITSVYVKNRLDELGHKPWTTEPDKYDWRKTIYLYDRTPELEIDINTILTKMSDNNYKAHRPNKKHNCYKYGYGDIF